MWERRHANMNGGWIDPRKSELNVERLLGVGLVFAMAMFLASFLPKELVPLVVKELLFYGAIGTAIAAAFRREKLFDDHVTGWDQAALLILTGLLFGFLVDHDAALAVLTELQSGNSEVMS